VGAKLDRIAWGLAEGDPTQRILAPQMPDVKFKVPHANIQRTWT